MAWKSAEETEEQTQVQDGTSSMDGVRRRRFFSGPTRSISTLPTPPASKSCTSIYVSTPTWSIPWTTHPQVKRSGDEVDELKLKIDYMGRSGKEEMRCRKHPKHRQSSGVCPYCLGDKLAKLSSSATTSDGRSSTPYSSSGSVSYSSSSSSSSSMASPVHCYAAKAVRRFTGSRSVACQVGPREGKGGRKKGFWSKLYVGSRGGEGRFHNQKNESS